MDVESWNPLIYHVEKVFHTPQDTVLENISPQRMQEALEIIGQVYITLSKDRFFRGGGQHSRLNLDFNNNIVKLLLG
ncbi:hypothetical protein HFP68_28080 [Bacillus sp. CB28A.1]